MSRTIEESLEEGRATFRRHAWRDSYELMKSADDGTSLSPEDLLNLGEAAWWTGKFEECIDYHQRSYAGFVETGNLDRAAYLALVLTRHYMAKATPSVAMGWFQRAERHLDGLPESVTHGYLADTHCFIWSFAGQEAASAILAEADKALDIGTRFGDRTLQARGLISKGDILVTMGRVTEGLALIDEATVAAVGGEVEPITAGFIYCQAIGICASLADYRRAGDFTEAAERWCARQSIAGGFPGVCRVHRAEIMRLRGGWQEAEQEARRASVELMTYFPAIAAEALYELGEIRLRIGDLASAEEAFVQAHELMNDPEPGLALLRLAEGKPDQAESLIKRAVEAASSPLLRAKLLPARVTIALHAGDLEAAQEASRELTEIAEAYGSAALRACAEYALGQVLVAERKPHEAIPPLRAALALWKEVDVPHETARTRVMLAEAYRAEGDEEAAALELRSALTTFEKLGALLDARAAAEALGSRLPARAAAGPRTTKAFMFTDMVKSTNLVEAIGDEAWEDLQRWHDQTLRSLFAAHGGEEVKQVGDGFFVAFEEAGEALDCAVEIQRTLAEHRRTHGFAPSLRVGVHAAEASRKGRDYTGKGVNISSRVGALAEAGEILTTVQTLSSAGSRFSASEPRSVKVKGISEPVEVVSLDWR